MSRCKHCKVKFGPDEAGKRLHNECIDPWYVAFKEKQAIKAQAARRAKAKVDRVLTKERKAAIQTIPQLIKLAQVAFNAFIRERDRDQACICCGQPLGTGEVGGAFDCGHYRSTGSASHLRFNEANAHAQRKYCNRHGAGRAVDYRIGLIARLGLGAVEALESSNAPHKWTHDELRAIRATYIQKLKELKKERE